MVENIWNWFRRPRYSAGERRLMELFIALEQRTDHKLEMIMSATTDLTASVAALETASATIIAAIAAAGTANDPAIQDATSRITAVAAALTAAAAPAPTP